MTIGEIIEELKQGKGLADIGKELTVGKERLSKALKDAGYLYNRKNGWTFTGTGQEPLNKAYTEFIVSSKRATTTNITTKERTNVDSKIDLNEPIKERTNVIRKRSSFDIDVELMKDLKIQAVIHGKNVYEIVENAIRKELAELKKNK
ncbi:hypothetical protein P4645_15225 [Lysinibacillus fusiformis]|uniref:hypothetical protein n=1 Tax=Lysinibacillus fusiformis TaxID=28031 RepID=UPI0000F36318|nr:hypothetical protein [Lysinibacillus fusiformis]EAZ83476.1 hypothetical protein BB14905_22673 [Bacillus sp. B14905]MED4077565.1 hypothetical protein [Lysinibacillus fusiformis]